MRKKHKVQGADGRGHAVQLNDNKSFSDGESQLPQRYNKDVTSRECRNTSAMTQAGWVEPLRGKAILPFSLSLVRGRRMGQ